MDADTFLQCALAQETKDSPFMLVSHRDIYWEEAPQKDWQVIDPVYGYASWDSLLTLEASHQNIPRCCLPREEFLAYLHNPFPLQAPEVAQMRCYLQTQHDPEDLLTEVLLQAKNDQRPLFCLQELQRMGAVFGNLEHRREFVRLYEQLSNIVRKPCLHGHTEQELMQLPISQAFKELRYYAWFCPPTEKEQSIPDQELMKDIPNHGLSMRRRLATEAAKKQALPFRLYDDCLCGSGLLYADCCGKR